MADLGIFESDKFSLQSMTEAINHASIVPQRTAKIGLFHEQGVPTTSIVIERKKNALSLVPDSPRGTQGTPSIAPTRDLKIFRTTHLQRNDTLKADDVQNVRAFGKTSELETVWGVVQERLTQMREDIDATIEWQRIGAIKGLILDADGSTVIYNLFDEFDFTQQTHSLDLGTVNTKVREKIVAAKRLMENALGRQTHRGIRVYCGHEFFDELTSHKSTREAYDRWCEGAFKRDDVRDGFYYANVLFEEYSGKVGDQYFIEPTEAYLFPEGVTDLFVTKFAPGDYNDTVNTIGLPYYAEKEIQDMKKGVDFEVQSNPISLCTRPHAVIKLTMEPDGGDSGGNG